METVVTNFEEGYSTEVPIVVSQSVYFFIKALNFYNDNIILKSDLVPGKISKYAYQYSDTNSPENVAEDLKESRKN